MRWKLQRRMIFVAGKRLVQREKSALVINMSVNRSQYAAIILKILWQAEKPRLIKELAANEVGTLVGANSKRMMPIPAPLKRHKAPLINHLAKQKAGLDFDTI